MVDEGEEMEVNIGRRTTLVDEHGNPVGAPNGEQLDRNNSTIEQLLSEAQNTNNIDERARLEGEAQALLQNTTDLLRTSKKIRKSKEQQVTTDHYVTEANKLTPATFMQCTDPLTVREYFKLMITRDKDATDTTKKLIGTENCDFNHGGGKNDDKLGYIDCAVRAILLWMKIATISPQPVLSKMNNMKGVKYMTSINHAKNNYVAKLIHLATYGANTCASRSKSDKSFSLLNLGFQGDVSSGIVAITATDTATPKHSAVVEPLLKFIMMHCDPNNILKRKLILKSGIAEVELSTKKKLRNLGVWSENWITKQPRGGSSITKLNNSFLKGLYLPMALAYITVYDGIGNTMSGLVRGSNNKLSNVHVTEDEFSHDIVDNHLNGMWPGVACDGRGEDCEDDDSDESGESV